MLLQGLPFLLLSVINFAHIKEKIDLNVRHKNHGVGQGAGTNRPRIFAMNRNLTFPTSPAEVFNTKSQARRACDFVLKTFQIGHRGGAGGVHLCFKRAPTPGHYGL